MLVINFVEVGEKTLEKLGHGFLPCLRIVGHEIATKASERFLGRDGSDVTEIGLHAERLHAFEHLAGGEYFPSFERVDVERQTFFEAAYNEAARGSDRFERNSESVSD